MERFARMDQRDPAKDRGEYYALIVSIAAVCFCVVAGIAMIRGSVAQFVGAIKATISVYEGGEKTPSKQP